MKRSTISLTIALALSSLFSADACAGMSAPEQTVAAGYALYQLSPEIFLGIHWNVGAGRFEGEINFPEIEIFNETSVISEPPDQNDFGIGPEDTGLADAIIRREQTVTSPGDGSAVTVPIELAALSLVSVDPIDLDDGSSQYLYFSLNPNLASAGEYVFDFADFSSPTVVGDDSARLTVNYPAIIGASAGPVHEIGTIELTSDFSLVPFSHFSEGLIPSRFPNKTNDGVNPFAFRRSSSLTALRTPSPKCPSPFLNPSRSAWPLSLHW